MSDRARASTSIAATLEARWKAEVAQWPPERVAKQPAAMEAWRKADKEAKQKHVKNPLPWPGFAASDTSPNLPGGLFNAMIAPLLPGSIKGILWYQGESNVGHASEYGELFTAMITSWRAGSARATCPSLCPAGQLRGRVRGEGPRMGRPARAAGKGALAASDGHGRDDRHRGLPEHPSPQQAGGGQAPGPHRARQRLRDSPGVLGAAPGERRRRGKDDPGALHPRRKRAPGGRRPVKSLEVAERTTSLPRNGSIEGDTLIVSSPDVPAPLAVRYAWTNAPSANLYGDSGLPAPLPVGLLVRSAGIGEVSPRGANNEDEALETRCTLI